MSARKSRTLRERLGNIIFNWVYGERNGFETVDIIISLFREEQRRRCCECKFHPSTEIDINEKKH